MIIITNNWKMWLAGLAVSLGIFLILYFTVIKTSTDTANKAVTTGLQQSQQAINQARQQAGGTSSQANKQLSKASQLTGCLSAAGTDPGKVQACQAQFGR